jgi:hypothetical protein
MLRVAIGFAMVLATLRTLGPVFVLCLAVLALVYLGPRLSLDLVRRRRTTVVMGALLVGAAVAESVWWVTHFHTNELEPVNAQGNPLFETLLWLPLWFLQSIAAFPLRNEPAHPAVYGAGLIVLGGALFLGLFAVERRDRLVVGTALTLAVAVPVALQTMTYSTSGAIWQGRYGWPLSLGVVALVGIALDSAPPTRRATSLLAVCGGLTWAFAHLLSILRLLVTEQGRVIYTGDPRWITASPWLVGLAAGAGLSAWARAVATCRPVGPPGERTPRRNADAQEHPSSISVST